MKRFHVLASDDGAFLVEIELSNGLAELYDLRSIHCSNCFSGLKGEELYAELHDWACFELGIDHEDCYLTNESETEILWS